MVERTDNVINLYDLVENTEEAFAKSCKDGFDRFLQQGSDEGLPLFVMIRAALSGLQQSVREQSPKFSNPFKNEVVNFLHDHYELEISDERMKKFKDAFDYDNGSPLI